MLLIRYEYPQFTHTNLPSQFEQKLLFFILSMTTIQDKYFFLNLSYMSLIVMIAT